ncbi:MAG: hypothetical protein COA84_06030 [Robiginitomaculum sp.]|nr:MAG: hypothetical protein COA84_06030 [Robiginitomaculum sp.]
MNQQTHSPQRGQASNPSAGGWAQLSEVSFVELIGQVFRRKLLMFMVFIVIFGGAMAGVMTLKKYYTAKGKVLVQFGEEYIYNPIAGNAGQSASFTADQMIQAEVGFITAVELKQRVLAKIGLRQMYPKLARKLDEDPAEREIIIGTALHEMGKDLGAYTAPNQPLVYVTFRSYYPQVARDVLRAFLDEYQTYRREILLGDAGAGFEGERESSEEALRAVNKELERFLVRNGIGDFEAERTAMGNSIAVLREELLTAEARRREIESALSVINARLAQTPKVVEQFTDDTSSGQLAALKLEREQLLAKYLPQSSPVKEIDARITRMESYLKSTGNTNTGTKRTGVNKLYQDVQTSKLTYEAEQQSNVAKISILKSQIAKINASQRRFQNLFPKFQRLQSRATIMEKNYVQFAAREQELKTRRNIAQQKSNNIRVIERPTVPVKGKSMKRPAAILAFLVAMFSALCAGLYAAILSIVRSPARMGAALAPVPEKPAAPAQRPRTRPAPPPAAHVPPSFPYIQTTEAPPAYPPQSPVPSREAELPVLGHIATRRSS